MRLKLGNSNAVVAPAFSLFGNEEAVMRTFVNGYMMRKRVSFLCIMNDYTGKQTYIKRRTAFSNHTFKPFYKLPDLALLLLDVADPVFLPGTEYDLFRVRRHSIQQWCLAINV